MQRRTKIICTLGPVSNRIEIIKKMAQAGMDVARLNFSHGNHKSHQRLIDMIRDINKGRKCPIRILQDLEGYRIRIGILRRPLELKKGAVVWISSPSASGSDLIPLEADLNVRDLKKGMDIFIADGTIALKIVARKGNRVLARVRQGGWITSKKGVNIPGLKLRANILTSKDKRDLEFGLANRVDFVAQSFVRNSNDIKRIMRLVKPVHPEAKVIAKIESRPGVRNVKSILQACDGVMIARGDLGVSLPIYQVPVIQKAILSLSNKQKKIDITATQMLESMTEHLRPTRAEVSDVANAIFDGSDYVMLSGETAAGHYPVESVAMMRQIIEFTERAVRSGPQRCL